MKVIVFGATGGTGRVLVSRGADAGHEMTAFARSASVWLDTPVRVITGDVLDPAQVADAVRGHDAVISCLGTRPWRHVDVCSKGIASIMPAMKAAGIRRIIAMSSIGVGEPKAGFIVRLGGALILRKAFRDKLAMEKALEASDLEWIVVRPGFLTSGKPKGKWRAADDGSLMGGMISRADTVTFMLQQLTSDEWLRRKPVIVW